MNLLPNENKLFTSNEDKIILTNLRIQMTDRVWGQSFSISVFLEDISSIESKYKSNILLLIFGVICVCVGFYLSGQRGGNESMFVGFVVAAVFLAVWRLTRKHIISVTSVGGTSLNFMVQGMGDDKINDFVYNVSLAKLTRVNQLAKL
ncbi:MAG: hypothetical protein WBO76_05480 [Saprospiraceae bacterium]